MAGDASPYDDDGLITDINVTPLVDIVLVLLIVFMITVPLLVKMSMAKERQLRLTSTAGSEPVPLVSVTQKRTRVGIYIDAKGGFSVAGVPHSASELQRALAARSAVADRTMVVIQADKLCRWQYVATAISLCHQTKLWNYRLLTVNQKAEAVQPRPPGL